MTSPFAFQMKSQETTHARCQSALRSSAGPRGRRSGGATNPRSRATWSQAARHRRDVRVEERAGFPRRSYGRVAYQPGLIQIVDQIYCKNTLLYYDECHEQIERIRWIHSLKPQAPCRAPGSTTVRSSWLVPRALAVACVRGRACTVRERASCPTVCRECP